MSLFSNASDAVLKACNKIFGTTVSYTHLSPASTVEIKGVFDNAFIEVQGVTTLAPILRIREADLSYSPKPGDTCVIDSTNYKVKEPQKDTFGGVTLILQKV